MAENDKETEAVEPEEKTLEDELSALEEVAASLTETKSGDHSEEDCDDEDCEEHETKAATITGHPYDLVVVDDDDQEDDAEDLLKPPGGVEQAKEMGPKKRVVVVEMDPEQITDDMKAYVVEVPDEDDEYPKAHVPDHEEEGPELRRRPPSPMAAVPTEGVPNTSPMTPVGAGSVGPPFVPEEDDDDDKGWGKPGKGRLARLMALANGEDPDAEEEEDDDEKNMVPSLPTAVLIGKEDDANANGMENRLSRLGVKSLGNFDFLCGIERTIRSGDVCNFCRGGCASEKGLPGLLEIEVSAEAEFDGEVVDSGYAPKDDMFVLDLKTADGYKEAYYAGNGTRLGWIALDEGLSVKSLEDEGASNPLIVSFEEAAMTALKYVKGKSYGVDVDLFHGEDAYVVEIDGVDGKSYDVYVSIDGKVLGTDMIELTDDEQDDLTELRREKDALEAELALKSNYEGEALQGLVEEGAALEDGSFPIVNADDLELAVKAAYRHVEAKSHIERRAEELERTDIIPSEWAETKQAETDEFMASLMELQMLEIDSDESTTE